MRPLDTLKLLVSQTLRQLGGKLLQLPPTKVWVQIRLSWRSYLLHLESWPLVKTEIGVTQDWNPKGVWPREAANPLPSVFQHSNHLTCRKWKSIADPRFNVCKLCHSIRYHSFILTEALDIFYCSYNYNKSMRTHKETTQFLWTRR